MERLKFAGTEMNQHSGKTSKATKHEEHSFGAKEVSKRKRMNEQE